MKYLLRKIRTLVTVSVFTLTPVAASASDNIRALWIMRPETQQLLNFFVELTRQSDQKVDVQAREIKSASELLFAVKVSQPDLVLGLTWSQVQFLANGGLLQPIAGRDIESRFSRSLYVSPSSRKIATDINADQVIAAPISVTLAAVCYDKTNPRVSSILGNQMASLEDIVGGAGIGRVEFPDPRIDPVGRAILLSAFQRNNLHFGWTFIERLDAKVDVYARNFSRDCSEVDSHSKGSNADVAFTTFEVAKDLIRRNTSVNALVLRDSIPVSNIFAAIVRKSTPDSALVHAYGQVTGRLLEKQISQGSISEGGITNALPSLRDSIYSEKYIHLQVQWSNCGRVGGSLRQQEPPKCFQKSVGRIAQWRKGCGSRTSR